jgi:hypothetical protein
MKKAVITRLNNDTEMGWSLFGAWYDSMTDFEVGEFYMRAFFDSPKYSNAKITYDGFINTLRTNLGDIMAQGQVEGLGLGIKFTKMSKDDVLIAADDLASIANGKTPASIGDFRQALIGQATATPLTDAIVESAIVQGFAKIGNTIFNVGDTTLDSLNFMAKVNKYLPFILPVVAGYIGYQVYLKKFIQTSYKK